MKKLLLIASAWLFIPVSVMFNGCLKDTGTSTYKIYTPIYETTEQMKAGIKSDVPQPIVNAGKMWIQGNTIFLVELEKGIHIIDNTNPSSPVNKSFINIPGNEDVSVKGNILYADCYSNLVAIDISNPANVSAKGFVGDIFPDRSYINGFYIQSGKVVLRWDIKDTTINLQLREGNGIWSNGSYISQVVYFFGPTALASSQNTTSVGGSMSRMAIVNDRLYIASQQSLSTVSIVNPSAPDFLTHKNLHLGIGTAETIYPFADKLFIGSASGMYIFSLSDPDNPSLLSTFSHASACDPVITDGTFAYITLHSGTTCHGVVDELDVVNVQDVTHPSFIKKYSLTSPYGLSKDGNMLFVCDKGSGLKLFDASDANNIILKQTINIPGAYDVICINKVAVVSAGDGLYQFDYSDLSNIKQLSKISLNQ